MSKRLPTDDAMPDRSPAPGRTSDAEIHRLERLYAYYDSLPTESQKRDQRNLGNFLIESERRGKLIALLATSIPKPLQDCRILDVGCGRGDLLHWFEELGIPSKNLTGADLLADRIASAAASYPGIRFLQVNAEKLPFPAGTFDLVICFALFSSILDPAMGNNVAAGVKRVLSDDGAIVWWDVRVGNPSNPNLRALTKRRIRELFPEFHLDLRSTTLVPPMARRLGPFTGALYPLLVRIPFLRTHYLGILTRHFPGRQPAAGP